MKPEIGGGRVRLGAGQDLPAHRRSYCRGGMMSLREIGDSCNRHGIKSSPVNSVVLNNVKVIVVSGARSNVGKTQLSRALWNCSRRSADKNRPSCA